MDRVLRSTLTYKGPCSENLIEFIKNGLRKNSEHVIVTDAQSNQEWTGKEIESAIMMVANYLIEECGVQKGDVCSLYAEESDQLVISMLAVISVGGIVSFLTGSRNSGKEVHDTATILNSKLLLGSSKMLNKIQPDLLDIEDHLKIVSMDEPCDGFKRGCGTIKALLTKQDSVSRRGIGFDSLIERANIDPEADVAVIQFSSGTTGKPKPIPKTHRNLCHLVSSVDHEELMDLKPGVRISGSLPITHRPGLWALLACVNGGSTFVILDDSTGVEGAFAAIMRQKITILSSSLPFLSSLGNIGIKVKDKFDLTSLQHIITSGAKILNNELPKSLVEAFKLKSLRQCFGMTESGWVFLIEQSLAKDNFLTVGHVVPGTEAVVIDRKTLQRLEANQHGELALRGPQIFPGYLTDKAGVLNKSDFTEDGWFRIGDQGYYDENEQVFIEGRFKELLLFQNDGRYFPTEIEAIISNHPAIEAACVVKVGEIRIDYPCDVARAYVTLRLGFSVSDKEIVEFVKKQSPEVILDGGVRILEKFPRLSNGKVDKRSLALME